MDDGVYQNAVAAAAEHGMSVSAWISRCTRLQTMRDALTRHQQWCVAEGITGPAYEQQRAHLAADAAAELDCLGEAVARVPPMPPRSPRFGDVWNIKGGVMGPKPWLIVSNDLYLELSEDNMLAVPIRDTSRPGSRVVTEPILDVGQAVLDRITALPRTWLMGEGPGHRAAPRPAR